MENVHKHAINTVSGSSRLSLCNNNYSGKTTGTKWPMDQYRSAARGLGTTVLDDGEDTRRSLAVSSATDYSSPICLAGRKMANKEEGERDEKEREKQRNVGEESWGERRWLLFVSHSNSRARGSEPGSYFQSRVLNRSEKSAAPASNGVFVVNPPSNASGLRLHPYQLPAVLPTSPCQPSRITQLEEPPLGSQMPRTTQPPDPWPVETFLTGEPKALGTNPIPLGFVHPGVGSVLLAVRRDRVGMLFIEDSVPFWGAALFITSGSLSVAAEKSHTSCLVRSSLGMNIFSAMAAFSGTAVLLMDFGVTSWNVGKDYLAVLTIFTILEFFIAVITTQATRAQANVPVIFLPDAFSTDFNIYSSAASPPPAYDNVAYVPNDSSA
ncbi:LOW QUALITY PROTEIN: membrane-spanning 4-domains subfamily A member 15 [Saccopteryx leptura]|uniref:LOW QUALITY PROTEIN: membrane-spanning 4-domains subfamily A member 15 n=1 Tax=Saccopteryx leptura TaxID=249018 RepID=UPI00339C3D43